MSVNGKRDDFTLADFRACGQTASLPRGRAARIVSEVSEVVSQWTSYADRVEVDEEHTSRIARMLRLAFPRK